MRWTPSSTDSSSSASSVRHVLEVGDERAPPLDVQRPAQLGEAQRQQVHDRDLADEGLRRRDADLEAGARVEHAVGVARRLRAHDVRHREDGRAALARETHGRERVGRLARLGDADDEVAGADHRVAVAVLRGDVHLDGQARPLLDGVAAHQTGVVARAAGDDDDALRVAQDVLVDVVGQVDPVRADRAARDGLGDRVGLLVDLLEHEGLVAGLLGRLLVPVDLGDLAVDRLARRRHERDAVGAHDDDLAVLDDLDAGASRRGRRGSRRR